MGWPLHLEADSVKIGFEPHNARWRPGANYFETHFQKTRKLDHISGHHIWGPSSSLQYLEEFLGL